MTSNDDAEKSAAKPEGGDADHVSSARSKVVRHFPEDPYSDGALIAVFDGSTLLYRKDVYFHAKLIKSERILYEEQDVYLLSFEMNFLRSFSDQYRFRGADIDLLVQRVIGGKLTTSEPSIRRIFPTVIAVDVSEREVQDTNEVSAGGGASAGPGNLTATVKQTRFDKTTFKGRRKFHGLIKGNNRASWRLYEEKRSLSGIPSIFRIAALVRCPDGKFQVKMNVSVQMVTWPKLFGLHSLYFDSSFAAEPTILTIEPVPAPIDWLELYEKAEGLFYSTNKLNTRHDLTINTFIKRCRNCNIKLLDNEEKGILSDFFQEFRKALEIQGKTDEKATVMVALKAYLATEDTSRKAVERLQQFMGLSSPEKEEAASSSAREPAKKAEETSIRGAEANYLDILSKKEIRAEQSRSGANLSRIPPWTRADMARQGIVDDSYKPNMRNAIEEAQARELQAKLEEVRSRELHVKLEEMRVRELQAKLEDRERLNQGEEKRRGEEGTQKGSGAY